MTMKKVYLLLIYLLAFTTLNAQYVTLYTPKGSPIQTFINPEGTNEWITTTTNRYIGEYGAENVLAPASRRYNCHSYAWNISEGGTNVVWMNQYDSQSNPNIWKYWTDGSYVETTENDAEKIFYYNGDHSAIKSKNVAGKYESKWGQAPLMRHNPTEGPSIYNMAYRRYYKKAPPPYSISGPSSVCNQATYTVENLPPGATVQWSAHPALQISSQQDNAIVVSGTTITGGCWVRAEISPPFDRVLRKENITVWQSGTHETPHLIQGEITPTGGNVRLSNEILAGTSNYYWWTDYETWTAVSQGRPYTLFTGSYNPSVADSASIIVDLTTPCGESVTLYRVFRWGNFRGNPPSFTLSPTPPPTW